MPDIQLSSLGSVIKTAYEGEANTNAFTDAEKAKLALVPDSGGGVSVQDEGSTVVALAESLNFLGSAVSVTDVAGVATITIAGGTGVITATDLGFALTGNPVDGDDGAVLQILLDTIVENNRYPVRIQFVQDNATENADLKFYCDVSLRIPSYVELDFGNIEIVFGANGCIRFQGSIRDTYVAEGDMLQTEDTIRVPAAALLSIGPGDWVLIEDEQLIADIHLDTPSANQINFEMFQVKSTDATPGSETITLTRQSLSDYTVANGTVVTKVEVTKNSTIKNARATFAAAQTTRNNHPFESQFGVNCVIENCHVERNWSGGFAPTSNSHRLYASVGCSIINCSTLSPNDPSSGGESYGVTLFYSYGCKVHNYLAQGTRHSLFLQCASRNIVTNFTSHDCAISDLDCHGINERENVFSNFTVVGGPTTATGSTTRTGIKIGNTYHLYGAFNNTFQNGVIRLGDTGSITTRGIEILPNSDGNVIRNVKILDCQYGILMTDQARSSDGAGPDENLTMERNTITDITIENSTNYGIRVKSNNANAGANTFRTIDDLTLRNIEMRNCAGGVYIEQTNRVHMDNITMIDQTGTTSTRAMRLLDNTNMIAKNINIIGGQNGIELDRCPGAVIDDVLFDLSGTDTLIDVGGNTGASVTNMKFRGGTADHVLTDTYAITAITRAAPAVITVADTTGLVTGDRVEITGVGGMVELNGNIYDITVINGTTFSLDGTDTSAYEVYTTGGTASTRRSVFNALTNAERKFIRVISDIPPETNVSSTVDVNHPIPNDASTAPLVTQGIELASATYTPISPATILDIEVVVPTIVTDTSNEQFLITLFDGSTCIGSMQHTADSSGAGGNVEGRLRIAYPITGYTPRTITARFGPRDAGPIMTLYSRHKDSTLARPYMIINDLGMVET